MKLTEVYWLQILFNDVPSPFIYETSGFLDLTLRSIPLGLFKNSDTKGKRVVFYFPPNKTGYINYILIILIVQQIVP